MNSVAAAAHTAYQHVLLPEENRLLIAAWIAGAPDRRIVETIQHGESWQSRALEGDAVRFEEAELRQEAELNLLAAWCERQARPTARPPAKTSGIRLVADRKQHG